MPRARPYRPFGVLLCAFATCAHAAGTNTPDNPALEARIARLKQELRAAVQRNQQQAAYLRALIGRLQQVEAQVPGAASKPAPSQPAAKAAPVRRKQPRKTETQKAVYQQENALFVRHLTLEPKFTYTYYDRNQINLNGFLDLSAIFLGQISIQKVKATTLQFDLLARDGVTRRLQLSLDLPFLYRNFEFIAGGVGVSAGNLSQANVSTEFVQGDINFGFYYQLEKENASHPNVVWNAQAIAPTGMAPYGIKVYQPNASNNNLEVPQSLPTGNGLWGVETGLSFVKTSDPGILFGSIGYLHYFPRHFSDISPFPGQAQPGDIALGDIGQIGIGIAFALNRRMSVSTSYAQSFAGVAKSKLDGSNWSPIIGSDANAASLNFGVTYGLSRNETVITNLAVGMTKDAPDVALSVGVPYSF
ncbi:MAG: cytochrome c-type biogenesis protein [Acidiferrobacteraceae bacterium]